MESIFITIPGLDHYLGKKPFRVNRLIMLVKEPETYWEDNAG